MLAALALLLVCRLAQTSLSSSRLVAISVTYVLVLVASWFLVTELRLVPRLSHGMFSVPVIGVMMLPHIGVRRSRFEELGRWAPVAALLPVLVIYGHGRVEASERRVVASQQTTETMEGLSLTSDELIVVWGGDFPYQSVVRPLHSATLPSRIRMVPTGWPSSSPIAAAVMAEFQVDNLYKAIYSRENIYLAASERRVPLYSRFVCEHYGKSLGFDVWNEDPRIYKVSERQSYASRDGVIVSIRWSASVSDEVRRGHERRFGLHPLAAIGDSVWRYEVTDESDLTSLMLADEVYTIERYVDAELGSGVPVECPG